MPTRLLNLGQNNFVVTDFIAKVLPIVPSQPVITRRFRTEAKQEGRLINCSQGKAARTVIILKSGHIVLTSKKGSAIQQELAQLDQESL